MSRGILESGGKNPQEPHDKCHRNRDPAMIPQSVPAPMAIPFSPVVLFDRFSAISSEPRCFSQSEYSTSSEIGTDIGRG
jgi:hypothetical protein